MLLTNETYREEKVLRPVVELKYRQRGPKSTVYVLDSEAEEEDREEDGEEEEEVEDEKEEEEEAGDVTRGDG